jgi:hypothetical protein
MSVEGREYEGSWENGQRQGEGVVTSEVGQSVGGMWNRGEYIASDK